VDAYRFSISWARVQPGGQGPISVAGLDHYDRLCDALLEQGITPLVTLYHWDLPSELHRAGGWLDPETGELFGQYANAVASRLGDRVGSWATLNEPWWVAARRLRHSRSPTGSWWPTPGGWRAFGRRVSATRGSCST
jgi:beta-glucosidase